MSDRTTIALDAMGGDRAPDMVVAGCELARVRYPDVTFVLVGDESRLRPLVSGRRRLDANVELLHAEQVVSNDDKPSVALRNRRQSSMRMALDLVREGKAAGAVSAGNTGALMAMAKLVLRTIPGVDRPAIASIFPTERGETVMLDLGANVQCAAENLVQFAVLGEVFARVVLGLQKPTVGLLNIGAEELKGNDAVREAASVLREVSLPLRFKGFVEGNDIGAGTVDVVVTDGFTGNVALKTAEGTARLCTTFIRQAFRSSLLASLGYLLARGALRRMRDRVDPRRYNGAIFLGLEGIAVKSHGGTDALGFANAIGVAVDMARHGFIDRIRQELNDLGLATEAARRAAVG